MKKYIFLSMFFLTSGVAFSQEVEKYVVQRPDGVSIVHYFKGSQKSLDEVLKDMGFENLPYSKTEDVPSDRKDRDYWKLHENKVVIDSVKKQDDLNAKTAKESEKEAVLSKLKISKEEARMISDL